MWVQGTEEKDWLMRDVYVTRLRNGRFPQSEGEKDIPQAEILDGEGSSDLSGLSIYLSICLLAITVRRCDDKKHASAGSQAGES